MAHFNTEEGQTRYFITTAIPYVNARPHIGHALEFVLTDALARYHRLKGEEVWFLTGTDENSLKNVQAAEQEGIPTQTLVKRNATQFYALRDSLNLLCLTKQLDIFIIRTLGCKLAYCLKSLLGLISA